VIGLVHLVWAPLGLGPLQRFLRSYHAHPGGIEHELTIVLNGARATDSDGESLRGRLLAELEGTDHRLIEPDRPVLDLPAYGIAARTLEHARLCFLNSHSVILADGWLGALSGALDEPDVGLVGATASWESQAEWVRGRALYWPYQLAGVRTARRDYPRFPNPHIRTTGFMVERDTLLDMDLQAAVDKRATYLLESGHNSITRRIWERREKTLVVGRNGVSYSVEQWPSAHAFRSGGQKNLLIADNRTRDWEESSPRLRRRLSRDAWGSAAVGLRA
jgi:hypothetical protein